MRHQREKWYAVRGVLTQRQLDCLPPSVYAEMQVFDPATCEWSEHGVETAEGCVGKNPPFDEIVAKAADAPGGPLPVAGAEGDINVE